MNKTVIIGILVLLALLVPTSALAESQTHSVSDMYTVRVIHVGDVITVVNTDSVTHSISGRTDRGDVIDDKLDAGGNAQLQFSFPGQFSFYDKYDRTHFGIIYVYDPSQDLSKVNVFNSTSKSDLFQAPQYAEDLSVPNTPNTNTPLANQTTNNETQTTITSDSTSLSAPVQSGNNSTQSTTTSTPEPTTTQTCASPAQVQALEDEVSRLTAQEQTHYQQDTDMLNVLFSMLTKLLHLNGLQ